MPDVTPHDWNAQDYDRTNAGIVALGREVLDRLPLSGDETVLDAGCGTGALTELLIDRLPQGRVIALDAAPQMVEFARQRLGDRADVVAGDLAALDLGGRTVDAVFSTATFHWIKDHALLFRNLRAVTEDGGKLVAQCGGFGNVEPIRSIARELAAEPPFAERLPFDDPWRFAEPGETEDLLRSAGYSEARCWLEHRAIFPDEPGKHLREVNLGAHLEALGPELGERFAQAVEQRAGDISTLDYVRLNIDATA